MKTAALIEGKEKYMIKFALQSITLSIGLATVSFGHTDDAKFAEHKAMRLKEIDEHIQKMQQHKACVSAAASPEAMEKCHMEMKAYHESHKAEHKERREERMQKRDERRKAIKSETSPTNNP